MGRLAQHTRVHLSLRPRYSSAPSNALFRASVCVRGRHYSKFITTRARSCPSGSHAVTPSNKPKLAGARVLRITWALIGRFDRGSSFCSMLSSMHLLCFTRGQLGEPRQEHTVEGVVHPPPRRKSHAISPISARTLGRVLDCEGFISTEATSFRALLNGVSHK